MTKELGEFEIIQTYFSPLTIAEKGAFSLTDDAAVIELPSRKSLVVTTDTLVQGVHFLPKDAPADIAAKLLRVSLSDLAAMGATPAYYNLSVAINSPIDPGWFEEFTLGLLADQNQYNIILLGGDTVKTSGPITLTITAMGYIDKGKALMRGGAKSGDDIWVSGSVGDAAIGLKVANGELSETSDVIKNFFLSRYLRPIPQTLLGPALVDYVNSAIDISDGLIADLNHICQTSNLGAEIQINDIPLSKAASDVLMNKPDYIELVLSGGDDFELLFTADKSFQERKEILTKTLDVKLTKIGTMVDGRSVKIFDNNGGLYPLPKFGFTHF